MRIHRLTLQAIGPFPGRHDIDLDRLASGGLFLLEGPTGSGKSTIIDAVVFALYGSVAGAETSGDRLHSHHAAPGVEPFVEMVFSTGAGVFRVWRSPKHERPKQRGGGTTTQNPRAKLWRLRDVDDESGEPVSAHVQEVGTELGRVLVLDRSQFTQTVVLPQGQFASFLRARPEDRRDLLQEVFGTEIYERLQDRLVALARDARAEVQAARAQVEAAVAAFAEVAENEDSDAAPAATDAADADGAAAPAAADPVAARLARAVERHRAAVEDARRAEEAATAAEQAARAALDAERDLAGRVDRRRALLARRDVLAARAGEIDAADERCRLARRAASVIPCVRTEREAAGRLAEARARLDEVAHVARHHDDVERIIGTSGTPDGSHAAGLRALVEDCAARRAGLADLAALEAGLPGRRSALAAEEARARAAHTTLADAEQALARRPEQAAELAAARVAAAEQAATADGARQAVAAAEDRLAAARRADAATAAVGAAEKAVEEAREAAVAAIDTERAVRLRWIDGIAGELAGALTEGEPCPVCGSATHPQPAVPAPDHPAEEDVERAAADRERAQQVLEATSLELARARTRLEGDRAAAQGRDVPTAETELAAAQARQAGAARARAEADRLGAELTAYEAQTQRLATELARQRTDLAATDARLSHTADRIAEDAARVADAAAGRADVAERLAGVTGLGDAARAVLDALDEHLAAAAAHRSADERVTESLAEVDLPDVAAVEAAALPATEVEALERAVHEHRAQLSAVTQALAEPALAGLTGTEQPDVPAAEATHADARARCTQRTRAAAETATRAERVTDAVARVEQALVRRSDAERRSGPVVTMADLAAAREGSDITLATFVLLQRFEDVVAAANERLAVMSDGRYALERVDEEGGQRSRKAGLGLRVRDHVTETPRDPRTLSGGETFYVSLCLALGLADVVTAEAGGVELGTLFVDEGFGSLDPETLDGVMAELTRLQRGGRAVGIVSHVAELKARIPERVEVRRTATGGSTLAVRA